MGYWYFQLKVTAFLIFTLLLTPVALAGPHSYGEVPKCSHSLGVVAIQPPEFVWWEKYNLPPPQELLSVLIRRSGCFTLADSDQTADFRLQPGVQQRQHVYGSPAELHFVKIDSAYAEVFLRIAGKAKADMPRRFSGHADSSALSYGFGGGLDVFAGPLDPTLDGYGRSDIGQLTTLAYIDAYISLVRQWAK